MRVTFLVALVWMALAAQAKPLLMAHMMPWYQSRAVSGSWGWHWTMNKFDPDSGRAASRFHPLIGYYDSSDPDVIEYQLLTMKAAGIDGVLLDWYGDIDVYDYLYNHRNTLKILQNCEKYGLKFGLVYEDQTVPNLIKFNKVNANQTQDALNNLMFRLESGMFRSPAYLKQEGKPVFLVFGPQFYHGNEFATAFAKMKTAPAFYTLMHKGSGAVGGYAWPAPQKGYEASKTEMEEYAKRARDWPASIPVAYPRFMDVYGQAGVEKGYPEIPDDHGKTLQWTLDLALKQKPEIVQLCTWNDWGEGTQIEPSQEYGYRALETIQKLTHGNPRDLRLPYRLYNLRKRRLGGLDAIAQDLNKGDFASARAALDRLSPETADRS